MDHADLHLIYAIQENRFEAESCNPLVSQTASSDVLCTAFDLIYGSTLRHDVGVDLLVMFLKALKVSQLSIFSNHLCFSQVPRFIICPLESDGAFEVKPNVVSLPCLCAKRFSCGSSEVVVYGSRLPLVLLQQLPDLSHLWDCFVSTCFMLFTQTAS